MADQPTDYRPLLEQALGAIEDLQTKLDAADRDRTEPIAIVGIGCRFPGADGPEAFWQLLERGVDAVREVPRDRWDLDRYYSADKTRPGMMYARHGGFLDRVDEFEPQFFGISPREARTLDPQQRLSLEVAWEALEHAAIAPTSLRESSTGVFVGIGGSDFAELQARSGDLMQVDAYVGTGGGPCFAAGRVSYTLGLRGPSLIVDTACSSSLVAVHLACQSLRQRECDLAIAGGVHVMLSPFVSVYLSRTQALAADGRCKAFDAGADGFVRGEGCGMVVLKRLSDAVAANDTIIAIVRGSALTQDGASSGLTVPNGPAQAAAVSAALAQARVAPADVGYVEAHGTGTSLGDPIEMNALCGVLSEGRSPETPLVVGSVKANIGHLEAAAGIAGLIKAAFVVQRGVVPPQIHFNRWNPEIDFQGVKVVLPTTALPWPGSNGRVAGVSSFGLSGTNAHVVLGAPPAMPTEADGPAPIHHALRLTARSPRALVALGRRFGDHVSRSSDADLAQVCDSANTGRAHFAHRAVVLADSASAMRDGLGALSDGRPHDRVIAGVADRGEPAIAFLFSGQGAQYAGMGRDLYDAHPVFRDALDRCDAALRQHLPTSLLSVLYPPAGSSSPIDDTTYTQPALFAFEYALACLWQSWGVKPAAMLGHSLGEYVAACIAGLLSLETALALVAARGRLMGSLKANGAMTACLTTESRVQRAIDAIGGTVGIASINAPENIVVSGDVRDVARVADRLTLEGVDVRPLNVSYAAHSSLLDPALDAFEQTVAGATFGRGTVPIVSNVTGQILTESEQRSSRYWRRHAREAVRFAEGIRTLTQRGIHCFLEVGPHTTLCGMAGGCLAGSDALIVPSLKKSRADLDQVLETVARLYVRGVPVDWRAIGGNRRARPVHLPTYPFDRTRHWPDALDATRETPIASSSTPQHPVLAGKLDLADEPGAAVWAGTLNLARHRFIDDHRIQDVPVVPATLYMELALAAATNGRDGRSVQLRDFEFHRPLLLKPGVPASMQVRLTPDGNGTAAVRVHSRLPGADWHLHMSGTVGVAESATSASEPLAEIRRRCTSELTGREFYDRMARRGNQWGPTFQGIVAVWQGDGEALSRIEVPEAIAGEVGSYFLHPALADASGQVLAATIPLEGGRATRGGAFVGGGIASVDLVRAPRGREFWAHARIRPTTTTDDADVLVGDVTLMDADGTVLCVSRGCRFWYLDREAEQPAERPVGLYHVDWVPQADRRAAVAAAPARVVIFADDGGVGLVLAARLRAAGSDIHLVARHDIRSAGDIAAALAVADAGTDPTMVVLLWALDDAGVVPVEERASTRCHELLSVVQVAAQHPAATRLRLWTVTAGAQSIGSPDAVQAMLWGLGRTVVTEHQEIWGGLVDLEPSIEPATAAAWLADILSESRDAVEDQIVVRGAQRFVPRLRRLDVPRRAPVACRPDATYLITGGGGGLGLEIADFLARRGARHLLLLGRSALPARDRWASLAAGDPMRDRCERIVALEARGISVRYAAADVGDAGQLGDVIAAHQGPPIRGVVHAAGVMQYQPIASQTAAAMREIFRSKVSGSWNLHTAFAELDFFVLFSSAACILPSPLVGSYAAANAFMDALAHVRRACGLPALSVNWGAWTSVGMGARFAREHAQEVRDTDHAFSPAAGIAALERLMSADVVQATALGVDWQRWGGQYPQLARSPFMQELMAGSSARAAADAGHLDLVTAVRHAESASDRAVAVRAYLAESVGAVLGFAPHQLDLELSISSAGFDSMMALELKNRLARELQLVVPLVRFLDGPSVSQLAVVIGEALAARDVPSLSPVPASVPEPASATATAGWDEGEI